MTRWKPLLIALMRFSGRFCGFESHSFSVWHVFSFLLWLFDVPFDFSSRWWLFLCVHVYPYIYICIYTHMYLYLSVPSAQQVRETGWAGTVGQEWLFVHWAAAASVCVYPCFIYVCLFEYSNLLIIYFLGFILHWHALAPQCSNSFEVSAPAGSQHLLYNVLLSIFRWTSSIICSG